MAELYTPRSVPDIQMTGGTTQAAQPATQPAAQPATTVVPDAGATGSVVTGKSGGFLQGRGDGMSDSIPATINDKQPARLADGEFVVPADVVAHLGNGSSKAGAQRLYEMMARVRKARTGTTKQAPKIKAEKFV